MPNPQRWLSTGYLASAPVGEIDAEHGIIPGVLVCCEGEAKGHGYSVDAEFISTVMQLGAERTGGLKARFGHPNMCSTALGTFLGRHKNFRQDTVTRADGQEAACVRADLFLSNEAKDTPNGNLYDYVLGMAQNEPDQFGTSIVFTPGRYYRRTKSGKKAFPGGWTAGKQVWRDDGGQEIDTDADPVADTLYVECEALHACDCVDDPAANDGLFSRFSAGSLAAQITEFLDLHPQVWTALNSAPEVVAAIAQYGANLEEFIGKYEAYKKEANEMKTEKTETAALEENPAAPAAVEAPEVLKLPATPAEPEANEAQANVRTFSVAEFGDLVAKFGAEIAAKTVQTNGTLVDAYEAKVSELEAEQRMLLETIDELNQKVQESGGKPAAPNAPKKRNIWGR